ncbi:hypothetical protein PCANC_04280 [Puccinia coronata f. sp. avenae]|uniref:N-acetyltransferase domain-containing protein n=1 Tax=Puccinia coronata f. sp. avenae TaxID=200324 RepID=A0A2N5VUF7_9BASI|nr:hypothetical protein PCASD_01039 [Puccinia coronata f. sp. avenae]PLW53623.1 hypothetical protein PCANC_04280 [Puccinia coronata f. sp. avenae]
MVRLQGTRQNQSVLFDHEHLLERMWKHLSGLFDSIISEGRTYPQEEKLGLDGFKNYFLSHDIFIGVLDVPSSSKVSSAIHLADQEEGETRNETEPPSMIDLISDRPLDEAIAGIYYIKPNYPGRSSHCCNGGFVVDPRHRGRNIGKTLARSFLHYAPLLGYRASVFNLVYKNNLASIAIWDSLGFQRVGLIPKAGRLKSAPSDPDGQANEGEEYVDAIGNHHIHWLPQPKQDIQVSTAGINRSNTAVRAVLEQPCLTGGRTGTDQPGTDRTYLSDQLAVASFGRTVPGRPPVEHGCLSTS